LLRLETTLMTQRAFATKSSSLKTEVLQQA
jgi:hypothetical protein